MRDAETSQTVAAGGWPRRLGSAVARRARRLIRLVSHDHYPLAADRAWVWLQQIGFENGLPLYAGRSAACPGVTAVGVQVAAEFGQRGLARRWADWLCDVQMPCGAAPDALLAAPSPFNTAQALTAWRRAAALLCVLDDVDSQLAVSRCLAAAERAAGYLTSLQAERGRKSAATHSAPSLAAFDTYAHPEIDAVASAALTAWDSGAGFVRNSSSIVSYYEVVAQPAARLWIAEAWRQLGRNEPARDLLAAVCAELLSRPQRAATHELAHAAALSFEQGASERGERLLRLALTRQRADGGFCDARPSIGQAPRPASVWAALHALRALRAQVRAEFCGSAAAVEHDPGGAVELGEFLGRWAAEIQAAGVAADVGSGRGRWLDTLASGNRGLTWLAVDPSAVLCRSNRSAAALVTGDVCDLPLASGSLAAVVAVEVLEHALAPAQAATELCRVVRPGGRVLIVDKPRRQQALSYCQPWERWFDMEEVAGWLRPWCDDVHCEPLRVGTGHGAPSNLLAWHGRRREPSQAVGPQRRAA